MADAAPKRNGEIDFWKFVASIYIVLFHSRAFYDPDLFRGSMALAVEFFFVVSGFFFALSVYRDNREFRLRTIGRETADFLRHRVGGFLYYYLFGFGVSFLLAILQYRSALLSFKTIRDVVLEFFLLSSLTSTTCRIIPADWYLSAMLIAMLLLYPFFRYKKGIFSAIVAPILGVGGLVYIMIRFGVIASSGNGAFPPKGLTRAVTSICLGVAAYRISELLKKKSFDKFGAALCSGICAISILVTFALFWRMPKTVQPVAVVLSAVFVAISASEKSVFSRMFPVKICRKLGEFSLAIYLGHSAVRTVLLALANRITFLQPLFANGDKQWYGVLIYLVCSAALAVIMMLLRKWLNAFLAARKKAKTGQPVTVE
ncbi:MAG: acyltransferase family protein [Clostridia bacterium]|nr:acyltransferase family protein [Clostridia bacterium]